MGGDDTTATDVGGVRRLPLVAATIPDAQTAEGAIQNSQTRRLQFPETFLNNIEPLEKFLKE